MLIIVIITDLQLYPRSPSGVFIKAVKLSSSCEHLGERQVFNTDMLSMHSKPLSYGRLKTTSYVLKTDD